MPRLSRRKKRLIKNLEKYRLVRARNLSEFVAKPDTDQALTMNHKGPKKKPTEEKPYKCDVCEKSMLHKNHKSHKIKPTGEKPYKCDVCENIPRRKRRSFFQAQKQLLKAQDFSEFVTSRDADPALTMNHKSHKIKPTGEKPYKRNVCERSMNHKSHEKQPTDKKPYKRDVCNKSMNHESHKIKPTGEKPYKPHVYEKMPKRRRSFFQAKKRLLEAQDLSDCDTNRDADQALLYHTEQMRVHTGEKPFECDVCAKVFFTAQHFRGHMRTHTGVKPFKCDFCEKRFFTVNLYKIHMRRHTGEKPYKCDVCEMRFFTVILYKIHMKRQHTRDKPFYCGVCGLGFDMTRKLSSHMRIHKNTETPYKCDVCGKRSSKLLYHTEHMRVHTGEKPFKCDICEKSFARSNEQIIHMRIHTRQLKCDVCEKVFFTAQHFRGHMRTHTGEKSFHCGICGLGFDMTRKLSCHVRKHKTKNSYNCDVCGKCFITASEFKVHKKTQCSVLMSAKPVRSHLTVDMKYKIICDNEKEPRPALKDLATKYGTSYTTIGNILKRKDDIIQMIANNDNNSKRKHLVSKHSKFEHVNKMTYDWFVSARSKKVPISGPFIKTKASMFADEMKIGDFKATYSWLAYWKSCYNIKDFKGT